MVPKNEVEVEKKIFTATNGRLVKLRQLAKENKMSESGFLNYLIDACNQTKEEKFLQARMDSMNEFHRKLEIEKAERTRIRAEKKLERLQKAVEQKEREKQRTIRIHRNYEKSLAAAVEQLNKR